MNDITKPTLLVDTRIMSNNLHRMVAKSSSNGLVFRPHFKTHQSRAIADYYRAAGVNKITVSSVEMAQYFAEDGWEDITVAFPTNIRERESIARLSQQVRLHLIADHPETIKAIAAWGIEGLGLFIEVDAGYHRTGVDIHDTKRLESLVDLVKSCDGVDWKGFLIHNGHTYQCRSKDQIANTSEASFALMARLHHYKQIDPDITISVGDTPSFSVLNDFTGFDEMRPGNFIFYDLAQWQMGSCDISDIALCMACPVVGIYPHRGQIVVYGGGVHFSKDRISLEGKEVFGMAVALGTSGWDASTQLGYMTSLSQEHGIISMPPEQLSQYRIGDLIGVLPIHACLAAESSGEYRSLKGELLDHF